MSEQTDDNAAVDTMLVAFSRNMIALCQKELDYIDCRMREAGCQAAVRRIYMQNLTKINDLEKSIKVFEKIIEKRGQNERKVD